MDATLRESTQVAERRPDLLRCHLAARSVDRPQLTGGRTLLRQLEIERL
jgi:hypothetical protein